MIGDIWRSEGGALSRFTRDLTSDARFGRLEPVRCREDEISRVIDILLRHGKNNPALVGPAGVGKTAIAEGLAQRIASENVPLMLRKVRILSLDHVSLLAGTTYRGQYEDRIKSIVSETTAATDAILFIDELHNLIGQGTAMGAAMDAANMLKPALVRGDFRVIGATTGEEYERWVLGDPALERRFQKVSVRELGDLETLDILHARKERLERHHNVLIADEALRAAVRLTDLHVRDRMRPDKAIDALDEACAHMQAVAQYPPRIEELIKRRTAILKSSTRSQTSASTHEESYNSRPEGDESRPENGHQESSADESGERRGPDDPIERFARRGFTALERFGAELEAVFAGQPATETERASTREEGQSSSGGVGPEQRAGTLATVEAELNEALMLEGFVVRGHDVARVVGFMANGTEVQWTE
jgi:ATP-dependent Clp protease ATP-binding subunit ClpA